MAQRSGLNLFTSEYSARNFGYSQARFALERKVHVKCSDSREFLRAHFGKHGQSETTSFVYLDAHWGPDLPLFEETRILFALSSSVVIMIDDFQVPDDPGYAFDSYGPAETLNLQYLRLGEFPTIRVFFPTLPSSREDGARRGCVVLAQDPRMTEALQKIDSLRAWYRP
jgi:hypothetical protein